MLDLIVFGTCILLLLGGFIVYFLFLYNSRQKQHRLERQALRQSFQQELLRTQLEIQEQTLQNVGQEIHDNIGQTLSLAKLHLNTVPAGEVTEKIADTRLLVAKAINDLRGLSKNLNSEALLAEGLLAAVERELRLIGRSGVFKTTMDVKGAAIRGNPQVELILFRIIQEGLNNGIKHSGASRLSVTFDFSGPTLHITLHDDGDGFDVGSPDAEGQGLRNMRNRARLIGAGFAIDSRCGGGTTIQLSISKQQYEYQDRPGR
jgi:signal transduction histidine kinase